jgi:hypothetical protein
MRLIVSALTATTLLVTSAFAATDSVAPQAASATRSAGALAPGKPAGIQKAQGADNTVWWILGAGVVIGGIVLVATGNGGNASAPANSTTLTQ